MKQTTLANNDFEQFRKPTRRDRYLAEMNTVVPWADLVAVIEPCYPKTSSAGGRPPVGLERMLRIHCLQLWFDLSDPAVEEALYDSRAMRSFVGIDLGREPVPDETTVMRFRHLLEENKLGAKIFEEVGRVLQRRGLRLAKGTIVDATIIAAPSSTKNADGEREEAFPRPGDPGQEPQQIADSGAGRAFDRRDQAGVRLHQGALPRLGQERQPRLRDCSAGQHFSGSVHLAGSSPSTVSRWGRKASISRCNRPEIRPDRDEQAFQTVRESKFTRLCGRSLKRAGITKDAPFRFHDLRHTWATWIIQNGATRHCCRSCAAGSRTRW
jgi:IS5 family transposase